MPDKQAPITVGAMGSNTADIPVPGITAPDAETTTVQPAADAEGYFDGPWFVFTAAHHLRRGFCCGNGCRHCPYDFDGKPVPGKGR